jgi:hypothetical protein
MLLLVSNGVEHTGVPPRILALVLLDGGVFLYQNLAFVLLGSVERFKASVEFFDGMVARDVLQM